MYLIVLATLIPSLLAALSNILTSLWLTEWWFFGIISRRRTTSSQTEKVSWIGVPCPWVHWSLRRCYRQSPGEYISRLKVLLSGTIHRWGTIAKKKYCSACKWYSRPRKSYSIITIVVSFGSWIGSFLIHFLLQHFFSSSYSIYYRHNFLILDKWQRSLGLYI